MGFHEVVVVFSFQKLRSKCDASLDDNGLFLLLAGRVHRRAMKRHANDLTAQSNGGPSFFVLRFGFVTSLQLLPEQLKQVLYGFPVRIWSEFHDQLVTNIENFSRAYHRVWCHPSLPVECHA